jgi:hypothetical protein
MKRLGVVLVLVGACFVASSSPAVAADYQCKGDRIEKSGSTWGYAKDSNGDYRIEKGGSSIGWAKKAGSDWRIETFGGSTLGWLKSGRIESAGGSTITSIDTAKSFCDCPEPIAAALYILNREGRL